jgi:hypothetical protein
LLGCNNNPIIYRIFNFERIFIYNESIFTSVALLLNSDLSSVSCHYSFHFHIPVPSTGNSGTGGTSLSQKSSKVRPVNVAMFNTQAIPSSLINHLPYSWHNYSKLKDLVTVVRVYIFPSNTHDTYLLINRVA